MADAILDVPPRFMWGWGPGVSGYCGSMSIQTMGIYYGSYISQDHVRGMSGGHDGTHEILLGRGGCCAAIDIMPRLGLSVVQWKYWSEPQPQYHAFLDWATQAVDASEPVIFGVYMQTENRSDFDHIVPLVGFDTTASDLSPIHRVVFNDLHSNVSLHLPITTAVATRAECHATLPWKDRFAYCLPHDVNYGIRVLGNVDDEGELRPARLVMDEWSEPDYSVEDGKGEAPRMLSASLVVSQLNPGVQYALLEFADAALLPRAGFLSNATGGVVSRVDFTNKSGTIYRHRVHFMSNSTTFYRVVRGCSRPHNGASLPLSGTCD